MAKMSADRFVVPIVIGAPILGASVCAAALAIDGMPIVAGALTGAIAGLGAGVCFLVVIALISPGGRRS